MDNEPDAFYSEWVHELVIDSEREQWLWSVFLTIWGDMRSGFGKSLLSALNEYCLFYQINSVWERQTLYWFMSNCLPEKQEKDSK